MENGEDRIIKESKVKKSLAAMENDPLAQKTILRLESAPIISHFLDKGQGLVFDYDSSTSIKKLGSPSSAENKLMSAAIKSGEAMVWKPSHLRTNTEAIPWSPDFRWVQRQIEQAFLRQALSGP